MSVPLGNNNCLPPEILNLIFNYCGIKENLNNALVCKNWQEEAIHTVKKNIINSIEKQIRYSTDNLCVLSNETLAAFCPTYETIMAMKHSIFNYSLNQIGETLNSIQKVTVCVAGFLKISSDSLNIPESKKEYLANKTFVQFNYESDNVIIPFSENPWFPNRFFPIELFHLKEEGNRIIGDINSGTFTFPLRGRLVQLTLEEGKKNVQEYSILGNLSRETVTQINLVAVDLPICYHQSQFYTIDEHAKS